MSRPLPTLLAAFVAGLCLSPHLSIGAETALGLVSGLVVILAVSIHFTVGRKTQWTRFLLLLLVFAGIGLLYPRPFSPEENRPRELLSLADGRSLRLTGIVRKMPVNLGDKTGLVVEAEQWLDPQGTVRPLDGLILLYTSSRPEAPFSCGDRILWMGSLRPVTHFSNPGSFDFSRHMALRDIYVTGRLSDERLIAVIGHSGAGLPGFIERVRQRIHAFFEEHAPPAEAALYDALIIGETGGIPEPLKEAFAQAGVSHVLAISGLHMGIVAWFTYAAVLWLAKRSAYVLLRFNAFKIAALCSIPVVLFYAAISGMSPPSTRAVIMVVVLLGTILFGRQWDVYNSLAIAMWAILLCSPGAIYAPSFQLSFAAVLSIVVIYPRWYAWVSGKLARPFPTLRPRSSPVVDKILKMLLISAIATIGTAPIVLYHFHRLSLNGLWANLFVIPLVGTVALPLGLVSISLIPISLPLADMVVRAGTVVLTLTLKGINALSVLSFMAPLLGPPSLPEICLFYAGVFSLVFADRNRWYRWCGTACLAAILAVEGAGAYQRTHSDVMKITFLDVGQGSSACLELPGGKTMIIDGGGIQGGDFDVGERVIAPFLRAKRIRKLDYVVLSHPHPDHLGGLVFLADHYGPAEVWTNGDTTGGEEFKQWQRAIAKKNILHRIIAKDGQFRVRIGPVAIDVWGPAGDRSEDSGGGHDVLNHRSLVLRVGYGHRHFLFPGDIDATREQQLVRFGNGFRSDVLLAPHHGSNASNTAEFILAVAPKVVVFSVGRLNRFHLPNGEVLRRYGQIGAAMYRTDSDGAVTCQTDGEALRVEPHSS